MWPKLITNRYQTQLGEPWVVLFGTPVYRPWKLFEWWYHYEANAPDVFDRVSMLAGPAAVAWCAGSTPIGALTL